MVPSVSPQLQALWSRGTEFLGCPLSIMGGAMSWVSERKLVSALSNNGAFGVLAASSMPPELLDREIAATKALTDKPFGVNLILMHPQLDELVEVCGAHKVGHVVLAGGIPKAPTVQALHNHGAKVIGFAPSAGIGRKLVKMGIDALIIEGAEAGGHIGPVATSVLVQEVLPEITDVPVFAAGGIGRGQVMASFVQLGAAGVQLGTRFVCAEESIAHPNFKAAFVRANARNATPSVQYDPDFPVIPVRAIENKATEEFTRFQKTTVEQYRAGEIGRQEAQLAIEHFWAGSLRRAVIEGDVEHGSLMAGQSVGLIDRVQPLAEILAELVADANAYLAGAAA